MTERRVGPAVLPFAEACEYLGLKASRGRVVLDQLPSMRHLGTGAERSGDRYWPRAVLDQYIAWSMGRAPDPRDTLLL